MSAAAASSPPGRAAITTPWRRRPIRWPRSPACPPACCRKERQREALGSDHYHGGMLAAATGSLHPGKVCPRPGRGGGTRRRPAGRWRAGAGHPRRNGTGFRIATDRGELRADAVLVATNGYSLDTRGTAVPWLARRLVPLNSYIIATEELPAGQDRPALPRPADDLRQQAGAELLPAVPDGKRVLWGGRASFRSVAGRGQRTAPACAT